MSTGASIPIWPWSFRPASRPNFAGRLGEFEWKAYFSPTYVRNVFSFLFFSFLFAGWAPYDRGFYGVDMNYPEKTRTQNERSRTRNNSRKRRGVWGRRGQKKGSASLGLQHVNTSLQGDVVSGCAIHIHIYEQVVWSLLVLFQQLQRPKSHSY
ncbi:hypothetical protein I7I48_10026 [Histoplasma ohiense]|nr:hypothetical protein I7I48_10026 [Histoplasma ohiense (nom. inval.)]